MDIEHDLEAWLIERVQEGWSQYDIEKALKPHHDMSQPTIGRNLGRIKRGEGITRKMRRAIRARFAYEAELDARVEADQMMFLEVMDALDEWQEFEAYEAEQALIAHERRVAAEDAFRALQEAVRRHARTVNRRMQEMGIVEKENSYVYADGAVLIREGATHFRYHDTRAEIVGYAPPGCRLSGDMTAAQYREGVTRGQRMRPSAVPAGQPRPEMIGIRRADLIPDIDYFDGKWFWGRLYADVSDWYELRDVAPEWWKSGEDLPQEPGEEDISWYGRVLELETKLLEAGLVFEESVLGWGDDWAGEVEEKREALRIMERSRARIDAAAARERAAVVRKRVAAARRMAALKLAGWGVATTAAFGLLWFVIIPFVTWVLRWIISGVKKLAGAVVAAYDGAVRFGEEVMHAAEVAFTSPLTPLAVLGIAWVVIRGYPLPQPGRPDPAYPWVMGITVTTALACMIALAIWVFAGAELP